MKMNLIIKYLLVLAGLLLSLEGQAQDSLACLPPVTVGDTLLNDTANILLLQQNRQQLAWQRGQLMDELSQAKRQTLTGAGMIALGVVGMVCGSYNFYINETSEDGDLSEALKGLGLAAVSLVESVTGLVIMVKFIIRRQRIQQKLRSPEMMFGINSFREDKLVPGIRPPLAPCLSVRVSF